MHKKTHFHNNITPTADAYDVLAKGYYEGRKYNQGMGYFYNCFSEWPSTLKLLGDVKGKKILDVGCGPGLYASLLIKKGAVVKGLDISNPARFTLSKLMGRSTERNSCGFEERGDFYFFTQQSLYRKAQAEKMVFQKI